MSWADAPQKSDEMPRLLVHVEGQTEEDFVNRVLAPHLYNAGYSIVSARLIGNARQRARRGGIRSWELVRSDILNHLKEDQSSLSTTMVDYFGLPRTWPGREDAPRQVFDQRAAMIEKALLTDISGNLGRSFDLNRFIPYVVMHEFEGLLFSDPNGFGRSLGRSDLSPSLQAIRNGFATPEEINDSPDTAPSKRVERLFPPYEKPLMGVRAAEAIGINTIRNECPLFRRWIERLEQGVRR